MERTINEIVNKVIRKVINEVEFKLGDSIMIPGDVEKGRNMIRKMYHMDPDDFESIKVGNNTKFVYKVKTKKPKPSTKKPKFKSQDLGRKEGETEQDYLERVRELNPDFANMEKELEGEEWRPLKNAGRYFGGQTDYTRTHEVSNMGRVRTIDFTNPMRSRISTGYDAPTRRARQFHLDTYDEAGEAQKTTPPIHTMVADAWLDAPEGNIEDYDVEHIDGNYHNNRADNLRYVLRKGRRGRKANAEIPTETPLAESVRRMITETVRRALNENGNAHQYQIVAYLIDPNADWQREGLSLDDYEESKRDFEILSNLNCKLNRQAINIFRKYRINSGAVEEHNSEEPFIMDIDGDGIYLLKRID